MKLVSGLKSITKVMEASSIAWYLFGAQAGILHGLSRATADIDITIFLHFDDYDTLIENLESHNFVVKFTKEEAEKFRVIPVIHKETQIPFDLVVAGPGLEDIFLQRAEFHKFEKLTIPVATIEDLIVMKILAGRAKDIDDASTLYVNAKDRKHIRELLKLLEDALDRSDLIPLIDSF